jgi:hypothetical protein
MAWVGAEGAGIDRGIVQSMATVAGRTVIVILTVNLICSIFNSQVFDEMLARSLNLNF